MKIYAINLPQCKDRRESILRECARFDLEVEIFPGVDGRLLTSAEMEQWVYRRQENQLTRGEIGASLSHVRIYQDMLAKGHQFALILEDDAVFSLDPRPFLKGIESTSPEAPNAYLLSILEGKYVLNKSVEIGGCKFHPCLSAVGAFGYVATRQAAESLSRFLMPIRMPPDCWKHLMVNGVVKALLCEKEVVSLHPALGSASLIDEERGKSNSSALRHEFNKRIRRQTPPRRLFRYWLWKAFRLPFYRIAAIKPPWLRRIP